MILENKAKDHQDQNFLILVHRQYVLQKLLHQACGDSSNDLDMIKAAGIGVAMGNADKEIKAAADFITKTNG